MTPKKPLHPVCHVLRIRAGKYVGLHTCMEDRTGELRVFIFYDLERQATVYTLLPWKVIGFFLNFNRMGYPNYLYLSNF